MTKDWISGKCTAIVISALRKYNFEATVDYENDKEIVIGVHHENALITKNGHKRRVKIGFNVVLPRSAADIEPIEGTKK